MSASPRYARAVNALVAACLRGEVSGPLAREVRAARNEMDAERLDAQARRQILALDDDDEPGDPA